MISRTVSAQDRQRQVTYGEGRAGIIVWSCRVEARKKLATLKACKNSGYLVWCLGLSLAFFANEAHAATCTSVAAVNNWNTIATWSCGHVPANADVVVIPTGGTTTLDVNSNTLASLTITGTLIVASTLNVNNTTASFLTINTGGTLTIGNNGAGRAVTVTGDITVNNGGTFSVGATAATHTLTAGGNIVSAGTINFRPSTTRLCNVTFNENGNQTVSGAGAYTFNLITLNMGATRANTLDMQSAITVPSPFLTITNGTYKHSNTSNITPWTADPNIPASGGFWLNAAATVTTLGFNVTVNGGQFRISAGTMNIGNTDTTVLMLNNAATTLFQMDGGALTVTGGIDSAVVTGAGTFTMSGGTITLMTIDAGAVYTLLLGSATTLNWSGGTIIAVNGDNTTDDIDIRSATQNITGGTLQMGSAATTAVNDISMLNGAGGQMNIWNLVLASGPARNILMRSPTNILNDLTIQTLNNLAPNAGIAINVGAGNASGNWTNNGTFTQSTTTVTLTGTSNTQAIGGTTATAFNNLTINKASNNVTINTTPTINATLTFTSGDLVTGANRVIVGTAGTIATPSASSYVAGSFQKNYLAGANLSYFAGNDFPVGDATNFTPVNISGGVTSTAGSLTVSTTAGDHPQVTTPIASTGIDANNSENRYWSFNSAGLTLTTNITATFTFIGTVGADVDSTASTGNFIVEGYDSVNWDPTTVGTRNSTSTQASNITLGAGSNDFAIGDPLSGVTPVPGGYNAFETLTSAGAILGKIQTKIVGTSYKVDIVNINAAKTGVQATAITVEVQLVNSSGGGALDVNGCNAAWPVIQSPGNYAIPASGRGTISIPIPPTPNSYRDVRLLIRSPTSGPPYTQIGCSTDRFAIRPQSLTITAHDATWETPGTSRVLANVSATVGNVHKASTAAATPSRPFTLRATPVPAATNYDGSPTTVSTFPSCAVLCTNLGALTFAGLWTGGGVRENATANYSEAGTFNLQLEDANYASVDSIDGSSWIIPATATVQLGRFVPDHFVVAADIPTPKYKTFNTTDGSCTGPIPSRTFTYIGQPFGWVTRPTALITAQNAANGLTINYGAALSLWHVTAADVTETYPLAPFDSSAKGTPAVVAGNGTGTISSDSTGTFKYTRTGSQLPFNANISLTVSVQDATDNSPTQGIILTTTPALFNGGGTGIAFDGGGVSNGAEFRYGRLKINNTYGSELLPLPVSITAQYWNGTAFLTNTPDNCTSLVSSNFSQTAGSGGVINTTIQSGGTMAAGTGAITLTKPTGFTTKGSVNLNVSVGATFLLYLPGLAALETFGIYKDSVIYRREMY